MKLLTSLIVGAFFVFGSVSAQAQNFANALKEWRLLAEQGNADAQFDLGFRYSNGTGVLQDYAEAVKWYRLSAEQGNANAQYSLGMLYKYGVGVVQDNISSHMWYNIAAANGGKEASKSRDKIATNMAAADISKAQAMAKECMNSGYKNCGW
jgi:uncharacterized protein